MPSLQSIRITPTTPLPYRPDYPPSLSGQALVRQALLDGNLVYTNQGGERRHSNSNSCRGGGGECVGQPSSFAKPRSFTEVICGMCRIGDLSTYKTPNPHSGLGRTHHCAWCGDAPLHIYLLPSGTTRNPTTTPYCRRHIQFSEFGRTGAVECWACGGDLPKRRSSNRPTYLTNVGGTHFNVEICGACGYVAPNSCGSCYGELNPETSITCNYEGTPNSSVCGGCVENKIVLSCGDCGVYTNFNNASGGCFIQTERNPNQYYCGECSKRIPNCRDCGSRTLQVELDRYYSKCMICRNSDLSGNLHNYRTDVVDLFGLKGSGKRHLGVEIELEWKGRDSGERHASASISAVKSTIAEIGIVKGDGSLRCGVEIISCPMTIDYHKENAGWKQKLAIIDAHFEPQLTCGLHIHVSRIGCGGEQGIQKLVSFMYQASHKDFLVGFAGRESKNYAKLVPESEHQTSNDRYMALNLINRNTVEFRLFSSTTSYSRLMEYLEFCEAITAFCGDRRRALTSITLAKFAAFVASHETSYPNLFGALNRLGVVGENDGETVDTMEVETPLQKVTPTMGQNSSSLLSQIHNSTALEIIQSHINDGTTHPESFWSCGCMSSELHHAVLELQNSRQQAMGMVVGSSSFQDDLNHYRQAGAGD